MDQATEQQLRDEFYRDFTNGWDKYEIHNVHGNPRNVFDWIKRNAHRFLDQQVSDEEIDSAAGQYIACSIGMNDNFDSYVAGFKEAMSRLTPKESDAVEFAMWISNHAHWLDWMVEQGELPELYAIFQKEMEGK